MVQKRRYLCISYHKKQYLAKNRVLSGRFFVETDRILYEKVPALNILVFFRRYPAVSS